MMNADIQRLLAEIYAEGQHNDASVQEHSRKMLNLEPPTAQLLSILVRSSRRTNILEIGTSSGYSTIWLAWATQTVGGHVTSIDRSAEKHALADTNLRRAHLRETVDLICGDASEIVARLTGPFDFVFFDADRRSAPNQLELIVPKLTPDAFILADNVNSHPDEIAGYLAAIEKLTQFEHTIIPVGKGLSLAYRQRAD
ncbi:methyltransferase domain-containing protein [Ktedonosporobacter rubrisoli]|uniref:Methyltransferase domain-containing protein n=1 Tax=Ktedonosporobacter rubrisoli TaxID=2509675 RepID=A0A4P6K5J2_KTERU|nr:class I SAM-dependent methyltransferase [Ktedonosporobacter rubrisoli]QBD83233.1 methyltransferase domain-containing protein [Ktedonosporobacter rubrisoli]